MSNAQHWKRFCMQAPRPASLRVFCSDGAKDILVPENVVWTQLGMSIEALEPEKVEAYDDQENLLRAAPGRVKRSGEVQTPGVLHDDPETARLMHFANILDRAYENSTRLAMEKLVEFVEVVMRERESTQKRLERLERDYFEAVGDNVVLANQPEAHGSEGDLEVAFGSMIERGIVNAATNGLHVKDSEPS